MQLRPVLVAVLLAACGPAAGPHAPGGDGADGAAVVPGFDATRWIPAHPTYAIAAHDLRSAQRGIADLMARFGGGTALDATLVSTAVRGLTGLDPLSPDALAAAGVDLAGGAAVFSEDVEPTLVLHLSAPDQMTHFLASHRAGAQVATVDGVEVVTVGGPDLAASWAIDRGWLWLHVGIGTGGGTGWLEHARAGGGARLPEWQRATAHGKPNVIAMADFHALAKALLVRAPGIGQCVQRVDAIGGIDAGFDFDERHLAAHVALDLGGSAPAVAASLLQPPPGWIGVATGAPLAVQWNVDVGAAAAWLAPCIGENPLLAQLRASGARAGRAVMLSFQSETEFTGAVSLDLSDAKMIADQLDQIPLRKHLESDRTFGPYQGHHLSIPALFAIDYVLTPKVAILARGDGLMNLITVGSAPPRSVLAALDSSPAAMSPRQWQAFASLVGSPAWVLRLADWKALHAVARLDGSTLVIEASAERR